MGIDISTAYISVISEFLRSIYYFYHIISINYNFQTLYTLY